MIYFVQAGVNGCIKIGFAIDPEERLRKLQTAHDEELVLLKAISGDRGRETEIHQILAAHRKRREWFYPTADVFGLMNKVREPEYEMVGSRPIAVLRRHKKKHERTSRTDYCPFCGRRHTHGTSDGHRVAHCSDSAREEVRLASGLTLRRDDGYLVRTWPSTE